MANKRPRPLTKWEKPLYRTRRRVYDRSDHLPLNSIDPEVAAVFWAVHHGARTTRDVARIVRRSVSYTWSHLLEARRLGLVKFEDHRAGTLRSALFTVKKGDSDGPAHKNASPTG